LIVEGKNWKKEKNRKRRRRRRRSRRRDLMGFVVMWI
jgi:hypothetical protein